MPTNVNMMNKLIQVNDQIWIMNTTVKELLHSFWFLFSLFFIWWCPGLLFLLLFLDLKYHMLMWLLEKNMLLKVTIVIASFKCLFQKYCTISLYRFKFISPSLLVMYSYVIPLYHSPCQAFTSFALSWYFFTHVVPRKTSQHSKHIQLLYLMQLNCCSSPLF